MAKIVTRILLFNLSIVLLPIPALSQIADLFSRETAIIQVHPGEKIQKAIDKAPSGSVILVSPGTYYETIKMKSNITLKSERGPQETIIDAQGALKPVVVCADKSVLDGFTITGRGAGEGAKKDREDKKGIHAVECKNVSPVIKNCIIRDNDSTGIIVRGKKAAPLITKNRIYQNAASGVGNDNGSAGRIIDNEIYQNGKSGVGCEKGARPRVEKNHCYENGFSGVGISGKGTSPTILNNEFYSNRRAGVGVEKGASPVIEKNNMYKNKRAGIGVDSSSTAYIVDNISSKNTLAGICVKDKSSAVIRGNEFSYNVMAGIVVLDESKVKIEKNAVLDNGTQGIIVTNSTVTVANNSIENNRHHGIGLYANSKAVIEGNKVRGNGADEKRGAGIMVVGSDSAVVRKNTLLNNYGPGIQVRVCSPLVTENYLVNDSVLIRSRSGPTIENNTFTSYGKVGREANGGVNIRNHSFPLVTNNTFLGFYGVNIRRSSQAVVVGNIFSGSHKGSITSGRSGIKISIRSSPVILRNIFHNKNRIMIKGRSIRENLDPKTMNQRLKRIWKKKKKRKVVVEDNLFL